LFGFAAKCKGRICPFDPNGALPADKGQTVVCQNGPRQKPRFGKHLETVANPEDEPACFSEPPYSIHDRSPRRHGSTTEIVAIGKTAGKNDEIHLVRQIL
jgi:hypothetical protein